MLVEPLHRVIIEHAGEHPCQRGGRLYEADRSEKIWTEDEIASFLAVATPALAMAVILALWTGQRQGDLLRLPWSAYDGKHLRLRQSKTGRFVIIPVARPLKSVLDGADRVSTQILTNTRERPWTSDGFRTSWAKTCMKAALPRDLHFHDLRGSAVVRLQALQSLKSQPSLATASRMSRSFWTSTIWGVMYD